jgi:hypothetical protein
MRFWASSRSAPNLSTSIFAALCEISKDHYHPEITYPDHHFDNSFPFMLGASRVAFHAPGKVVPVEECDGAISKEQVMMYPPGIPLIVPGEVWTKELVERVKHYQEHRHQAPFGLRKPIRGGGYRQVESFPALRETASGLLRKPQDHPTADGYHLPFEGLAHEATVMLMPYRQDTWREKAVPAQEAFTERHQGDCPARKSRGWHQPLAL